MASRVRADQFIPHPKWINISHMLHLCHIEPLAGGVVEQNVNDSSALGQGIDRERPRNVNKA